ncbi:MAG: CBS domain-containing protein [Dehalococcoidia bacterium]
MLVRDVMTTNVVTVPSNTPVLDARKIMETHNIRRLPVVDKGKLVGVVTKNMTRRAAPTEATSLSVWEINYLTAKMKVKDIMRKNPVTATPDITVECAVATAQERGVGALPVVEDNLVVGIITTNDFFYKILNPLLGVNEGGKRIIVYGADTPDQIVKVMDVIKAESLGIKALHTIAFPGAASRDLIIHLDTENASGVSSKLRDLGFQTEEREHRPC